MENPKNSAQGMRETDHNQKPYPELEDGPVMKFEDFKAPYHQTPLTELTEREEFRQSLPFLMIGWARAPISNMSDDDLRLVRYAEKYGL
ncbi:hypothetical protein J2Y45_002004 [Dyadobacter sp. BE34]|uniref:Uncharacterized protein n=2 Tax=Dyadobacter fermentans TaxID=94254 RepID=A0ABU1QWZ9_9BACT|nr:MULTISPECIES: hypothetical protein [unclassified Dyadobacter]MDR6805687.1 hypothetical protein [Dyadobacter fermentans]MDR7042553.1 hypothetical protein [Dyadobacter sp. BE242]MDR7196865.1 hypothetical protein [Dyadobacter sp. BE34]MDR7215700.1 hypothetical protein [Dyadobacter sp. BE31]MDR7263236.1 hypothetical protein [Dyadobacter sp. BE32]